MCGLFSISKSKRLVGIFSFRELRFWSYIGAKKIFVLVFAATTRYARPQVEIFCVALFKMILASARTPFGFSRWAIYRTERPHNRPSLTGTTQCTSLD